MEKTANERRKKMKVTLNIEELQEKWWDEVNKDKEYSEHIQSFCQSNKCDTCRMQDFLSEEAREAGSCDGCPFFDFIADFEDYMVESTAKTTLKYLNSVVEVSADE